MSRTIKKFVLAHDQARRGVAELAMVCEQGAEVTFAHPNRSTEQNARMWAMLSEVAEQVEWHGQYLTAEDWKHIFSATLHKMRVVPNLEGTGFVALGQSTRAMTKKEFSDLFLLIESFGAERGVVFDEN